MITPTAARAGQGALTRWFQGAAQTLRDRPVLAACLLAAMTLAAYAPSIGGPFLFDDRAYVVGDDRMHASGGLGRIWTEVGGAESPHQYCPLTTSLFWLQYQAWGPNPAGYRVLNLVLHVTNSLLLWTLLRRLRVPWAWLAAALFALHPVHVPSVAWIAELKNVLSGFFFLSSILAFGVSLDLFEPSDDPSGGRPQPHRALAYAAGLALFAAALLSKSAAALVPVALLAAVWWRRGTPGAREIRMLLPLLLLGLGYALGAAYLEHRQAEEGWAPSAPWPQRLLVAGRALWFYVGKLIWPHPLSLIYPRWDVKVGSWWQWLLVLGVPGALVGLWHERPRLGRAPFAVAGYFAAAVVPVSLAHVAFNRFSSVADHWLYWASFGPLALIAGGAGTLAARAELVQRRVLWAGAALALPLLAALTWQRAGVFASRLALWGNTVENSPECPQARYNLGLALQDSGRLEDAAAQYRRAIQLDPAYAMAHNNFGIVLRELGETRQAVEHYQLALDAAPRFSKAHVNLGDALLSLGRAGEAMAHYQEALRIDPGFAGAHFNFAAALRGQGSLDQAIQQYEAALALEPGWSDAHVNLGEALQAQGRLDEAISHYREALRLDKTSAAAAHNLALALEARVE